MPDKHECGKEQWFQDLQEDVNNLALMIGHLRKEAQEARPILNEKLDEMRDFLFYSDGDKKISLAERIKNNEQAFKRHVSWHNTWKRDIAYILTTTIALGGLFVAIFKSDTKVEKIEKTKEVIELITQNGG